MHDPSKHGCEDHLGGVDLLDTLWVGNPKGLLGSKTFERHPFFRTNTRSRSTDASGTIGRIAHRCSTNTTPLSCRRSGECSEHSPHSEGLGGKQELQKASKRRLC